ncbi:MAG: hypothetical protein QF464_20460, partial [Myxococcota bacterium]|nr:hypothetical protein [Myxococcota bacterium]
CLCPDGATPTLETSACCGDVPECKSEASPTDTDADGCLDTCLCEDGSLPDDTAGCPKCPDFSCAGDAVYVIAADTDADGCLDEKSVCKVGSQGVDTDEDGCRDACEACEESLSCELLALPTDTNGDNCPDACQCEDGSKPEDATGCCGQPPSCPPEGELVDTTGDLCPDRCRCPDGQASVDGECPSACPDQGCDTSLPLYAYLVDQDGDGCYDYSDACPLGTQGADATGDGCWDHCEVCASAMSCPDTAVAIDTDADNCADTCQHQCEQACDCVAVAGEPFAVCDSPDHSTSWSCVSGACHAQCVPVDTVVGPCTEGQCESNAACGPAQFCQKDAGACDSSGKCEEMPSGLCVADLSNTDGILLCGCDGESYQTACHANQAGTTVANEGPCAFVDTNP